MHSENYIKNAGDMAEIINNMTVQIHQINREAGWYTNTQYQELYDELNEVTPDLNHDQVVALLAKMGVTPVRFNFAEKLALIHSEASEMLEGHRKGLMDEKLPHRKAVEVEAADLFLRLMDIAGFLEMDLGGAVEEKITYNKTREDHKLENRLKPGGKKY